MNVAHTVALFVCVSASEQIAELRTAKADPLAATQPDFARQMTELIATLTQQQQQQQQQKQSTPRPPPTPSSGTHANANANANANTGTMSRTHSAPVPPTPALHASSSSTASEHAPLSHAASASAAGAASTGLAATAPFMTRTFNFEASQQATTNGLSGTQQPDFAHPHASSSSYAMDLLSIDLHSGGVGSGVGSDSQQHQLDQRRLLGALRQLAQSEHDLQSAHVALESQVCVVGERERTRANRLNHHSIIHQRKEKQN
jgi:hypothetical protein